MRDKRVTLHPLVLAFTALSIGTGTNYTITRSQLLRLPPVE